MYTSKIIHNKLFYNTVKITRVSEKKSISISTLACNLERESELVCKEECM